jgi:hypothetical protein
MPRVIVITDQARSGSAPVLLDERVNSVHLSTDHAAMQFIERVGWAISDAEEAERVHLRRPAAAGASRRHLPSLGGRRQARSPFANGRSSAPAEIGRHARTPSSARV